MCNPIMYLIYISKRDMKQRKNTVPYAEKYKICKTTGYSVSPRRWQSEHLILT